MTDFARARANMVEGQIRAGHIHHPGLLRALAAVPREVFLPRAASGIPYSEAEIIMPDASSPRLMPSPAAFAALAQLADIRADDLVLDAGCLSGYSSAVLARLAPDGAVIALEESESLAVIAGQCFERLGITNVTIRTGALLGGAPDCAPFDVIVLEGAVREPPARLFAQLKEGGRLAAIIDEGGISRAWLFVRSGARVSARACFDAHMPPLSPPPAEKFAFDRRPSAFAGRRRILALPIAPQASAE